MSSIRAHVEFLSFLQTTARPQPFVLFGILAPAITRRAAATAGLGQRRGPVDVFAEKKHGGMQNMLLVGVGIVFRNLRLFLEELIDRLRNVEGLSLPLDRDVMMDHSRDRLRRRGGTFRLIHCRRAGFLRLISRDMHLPGRVQFHRTKCTEKQGYGLKPLTILKLLTVGQILPNSKL